MVHLILIACLNILYLFIQYVIDDFLSQANDCLFIVTELTSNESNCLSQIKNDLNAFHTPMYLVLQYDKPNILQYLNGK